VKPGRQHSLRRYLLAGIVLPIALFVSIDAVDGYRRALDAINTAYEKICTERGLP